MANNLNIDMIIELQDKASAGLAKLDKNVKKTNKSMKDMSVNIDKGLKRGLMAVGAAAVGVGAAILATGSKFETLKATLTTITGSSEEAGRAFEYIQSMATKMPSSLEEVTTAFTRLTGMGIAPTEQRLMAFSDIAAGTGKSLIQFTEAVGDAAMGEFERLKEFNIKARTEADKYVLTYKGIEHEVEKSSEGIVQALTDISETNFGGASEERMKTLSGEISNLGVEIDNLLNSGYEGGIGDFAKKFVAGFADIVKNADMYFNGLKSLIVSAIEGITEAGIHMKYAFLLYWNAIAFAASTAFDNIANYFIGNINEMIEGINKLRSLMGMEDIALLESVDTASDNLDDIYALHDAKEKEIRLNRELGESIRQEIIDSNIKAASAVGDYTAEQMKKAAADREAAAAEKEAADAAADKLALDKDRLAMTKKLRTNEEIHADAIKEASRLYQGVGGNVELYERAVKAANDALADSVPATEEAMFQMATMKEMWLETAKSMQSSFSDFFVDVLDGKFGDLATSFRNMINKMVADLAASALMNWLVGGNGTGGVLSGIAKAIGARAGGGPVSSGHPYVVGEMGPELFIPQTTGRIATNSDVAASGAGSSGGGTANINIYAMDSQDVMRGLEKNKRAVAELVFGTSGTYNLRTA